MAPSVSKEHLIRGSESSIWGLSGFEMMEDDSHRFTERMWTLLNSKLFNTVIIVLVLVEGLVIFAELLIDLDLIQDPYLKTPNNCTFNVTNSTLPPYDLQTKEESPNLILSKKILAQISLIIVTVFVSEVLLRIFCGRAKYVVQPFELLDSILVFVVFIVDLIFFLQEGEDLTYESARKQSGQEAALLIVVLRLWRIQKIIQSIAEDAQAKVLHMLMICEKEKNHAEHKVDILILKVEDLEHEVAYLKEKAKKCDKESAAALHQISLVYNRKPIAKRTGSNHSNNSSASISFCPCKKTGPSQSVSPREVSDEELQLQPPPQPVPIPNYTSNRAMSNQSTIVHVYSPPTPEELDHPSIPLSTETVNRPTIATNIDLNKFALTLAQNITCEVVNALLGNTKSCYQISQAFPSVVEVRVADNSLLNHSISKDLRLNSSPDSSGDMKPALFSLQGKCSRNEPIDISSPAMIRGAGSHDISMPSAHSYSNFSSSNSSSDMVFVSQSLAAAHQLNEEMEIERIKRIEFPHNDENEIPLTSL